MVHDVYAVTLTYLINIHIRLLIGGQGGGGGYITKQFIHVMRVIWNVIIIYTTIPVLDLMHYKVEKKIYNIAYICFIY